MPSQKKWESSMNVNDTEIASDAVAEPRHRVGPKGVSSGLSFRELPEPCFAQLKKVCLHYTEKCSGMYENNKMAARYVHQLASEVMFLLSGIAEEIQVHHDIAKLAEQRLGEWNTNFPESLKAIGSPQAIAALLKTQRDELRRLEGALQQERAAKHRDMSHALTSMDCQLHASRSGALHERRQLGLECEALEARMQQRLEAAERERGEDTARLHEYYAAQLAARNQHYEALLAARDTQIESLVAEHQRELHVQEEAQARLAAVVTKQRDTHKAQVKLLQERIDSQSDGNSVATDDMSLDGSESSFTLAESTVTGAASSTVSASGQSGRGRRGEGSRKYKRRLRRVMKELTACHECSEAKDGQLRALAQQLAAALQEAQSCRRKEARLRESCEGLRGHLQRCAASASCGVGACACGGGSAGATWGGRGDFDQFAAERQVLPGGGGETLNVLQHSPHFLHHSRHQLLMKSTVAAGPHARVASVSLMK